MTLTASGNEAEQDKTNRKNKKEKLKKTLEDGSIWDPAADSQESNEPDGHEGDENDSHGNLIKTIKS